MNSKCAVLPFAGFALIIFTGFAVAEVPLLINYRGYIDVADPGIGLGTGALTVELEFNLYDTSEIEGVTPLWTETQTAQLLDGNFTVLLGNVSPLSPDLFSGSQRYLTVSVGGSVVAGPQQVLSVPYAMQAGNVYSASGGNVGIGTTSPTAKLDVNGMIQTSDGIQFPDGTTQTTQAIGDGHSLDSADGSPADAISVDNDGQVGIGTASPEADLHLSSSESVRVLLEADTDDDLIGDASDHPHIQFSQDGGLVQANVGFLEGEDNVFGIMSEYQAVHADLVLGTSDTERMRITADGKVGIGTLTPSKELQVAGEAIVDETLAVGAWKLQPLPVHWQGTYLPYGGLGIGNKGLGAMLMISQGSEADYSNMFLFGVSRDAGQTWEFPLGVRKDGKVWIQQEDWIAPTLENNWVNYGGHHTPAGYYKDSLGIVHLRGIVYRTVARYQSTIFTLPEGYRPEYQQVCCTLAGAPGIEVISRLDITTSGLVRLTTPNDGYTSQPNNWIALEGISFRAYP